MQSVLLKVKIREGKIEQFRTGLEELKSRYAECVESLNREGVSLESFFISGSDLYIFKRVTDYKKSQDVQREVPLKIYETVQKIARECFESRTDLFSDFDLIGGG